MKKLILSAVFASALIVSGAYAQTETTTESTTTTTKEHGKEHGKKHEAVTETTTTTTEGTIEEHTPGETIVVRTAAAEPVHYRLSKKVVYVNKAGKVVEATTIKKSAPVSVHYVKEGNETVVDRVIVD